MVDPQKKDGTAAILKKLPSMMLDTVFSKMFIDPDEEAQKSLLPLMKERSSTTFDDVFRKIWIIIHDPTNGLSIVSTNDTDGILQLDR